MKYILELDNEIFSYMKSVDGTVERYIKNRVLKPIMQVIRKQEEEKILKKEQKVLNIKLKEMEKTANIKLEVQSSSEVK